MSNKQIDKLEQEFVERGTYLVGNYTDPLTYLVVMLDGIVGVGDAWCNPCDEYDFNRGREIALRKALKHIYEQRCERKSRGKKRNKTNQSVTVKTYTIRFNEAYRV